MSTRRTRRPPSRRRSRCQYHRSQHQKRLMAERVREAPQSRTHLPGLWVVRPPLQLFRYGKQIRCHLHRRVSTILQRHLFCDLKALRCLAAIICSLLFRIRHKPPLPLAGSRWTMNNLRMGSGFLVSNCRSASAMARLDASMAADVRRTISWISASTRSIRSRDCWMLLRSVRRGMVSDIAVLPLTGGSTTGLSAADAWQSRSRRSNATLEDVRGSEQRRPVRVCVSSGSEH